MKRAIATAIIVLTLSVGLAQDGISMSVETRLSIVESRLSRLELDVGRLAEVPTSLARIEEKLTTLSEKASTNSDVLQNVGLGTIMSVITGGIAYLMGRRQGHTTK